MSLTENKKYIRLAYLKSRYGTDSFGYDSYSDEDFAFEKMSEEMFADSERPLKNPRVPGCDPHKVPSKGSGDGECYQVHKDYGTAKSGENGSDERKEYMVNYRKHHYDYKTGPKDGMDSRKIVPKPKGDKHDRSQKKEATLISELRQERMGLLKMAYDHPHLRGEIMPLLKKKAYRKSKSEKVKKPCKPLKSYGKGNKPTAKDRQQYLEDYKNGKNTGGECYDIYHEWGKAPGNGGNRKEYYKWYNSKVRGKDPSAKTIKRPSGNKKQIADANYFSFFSGMSGGEKTMKSLKKWLVDNKIPETEWGKYIKDEKYVPKTDTGTDTTGDKSKIKKLKKRKNPNSDTSGGSNKQKQTPKTETPKTETPKTEPRTVTRTQRRRK